MILYVNHFDKLDIAIYGNVIEQYLATLENVAGFAALNHYDPQRGETWRSRTFHRVEYSMIDKASKLKGFGVIPVVQEKATEKEYYSLHREAIQGKTTLRFNWESVQEAKRYLTEEPGRILVVAPEGGREENRRLQRAHMGFLFVLASDNVFAESMVIVPPNTRRLVPPYSKVKVIPGQPFDDAELTQYYEMLREKRPDITKLEIAMAELGRLLPERNQGHYRQSVKDIPPIAQFLNMPIEISDPPDAPGQTNLPH